MKASYVGAIAAFSFAIGMGGVLAVAQSGQDRPDVHVALARAAAAGEHTAIFDGLCTTPGAAASGPARAAVQPAAAGVGRAAAAANSPRRGGPSDPAAWHAEPVKVFDNLYWVGQTEYSAWAVTTSAGIIVVDTIYDYSVEDEVVGGLKKLGFDPATIKYAIVSHGHSDHSGGAKYLQDHFGTHVLMSAADWDLLDRTGGTKPARDLVVTDGQTLTLGDETVTMYLTPGHTYGTISTLIPVKDRGTPHLVAEWGGTAFNWVQSPGQYITPDRPPKFWFDIYDASARKFRDVVAKSGADALISNHTNYDGSKVKLPAVLARKPGDPNPYVIGNQRVQNYLTVASECAKAASLRIQP